MGVCFWYFNFCLRRARPPFELVLFIYLKSHRVAATVAFLEKKALAEQQATESCLFKGQCMCGCTVVAVVLDIQPYTCRLYLIWSWRWRASVGFDGVPHAASGGSACFVADRWVRVRLYKAKDFSVRVLKVMFSCGEFHHSIMWVTIKFSID